MNVYTDGTQLFTRTVPKVPAGESAGRTAAQLAYAAVARPRAAAAPLARPAAAAAAGAQGGVVPM